MRKRVSAQPPARPRTRLSNKGKALAGLGALTLVLGLGSTTGLGEATLNAAVATAKDQMDIMRERSPGARTAANMTKGKPGATARALSASRGPQSAVAAPIPGALPSAVAAPAAVAGPALLVPPEITSGSAVVPGAVPGGGGVFVGGPGAVFGPIGGGGGGIGGPGGGGIIVPAPGETGTTLPPETLGPIVILPETPVVTTPPVGAPIPEPASWALMILGFGATGAMLRLRLRVARCESRAQA